jgi:hypothetical protein
MIKIQNPKPVALSKERTSQCFGHDGVLNED